MQVCTEDDGREARQHVRQAWMGQLGSAPRRSGRARGAGGGDALSSAEQVGLAGKGARVMPGCHVPM